MRRARFEYGNCLLSNPCAARAPTRGEAATPHTPGAVGEASPITRSGIGVHPPSRAVRAARGRRPLGRMQPATGPPPTQSSDRARSGRTAAVRLSGCASWSARQRATGARTIPRRAPGTSYIDGTGRSKPGNIRHVRRRKRASFLSSAVRAHNAGGCSRRARKISKIFSHQSAVSSSLGEELRTISTSTNTGKWSDIWLGTVRWEVTRKA